MSDLLTSELSFARSPELANAYNVEPWDGSTNHVQLPAGERSGIFARAGLLVSGLHTTNPVQKGLSIRENVLCDSIPDPPQDLLNAGAVTVPDFDANMTTRERFSMATDSPACMGCHQAMNPIGFAFEGFDAFGRARDEEIIIDALGEIVNYIEVDSSSAPAFSLDDTTTVQNNITEFNELLDENGMAHSCFVRKYFRFAYGRHEDDVQDGCVMERMREELYGENGDGSIRQMMMGTAEDIEFKRRKLGED